MWNLLEVHLHMHTQASFIDLMDKKMKFKIKFMFEIQFYTDVFKLISWCNRKLVFTYSLNVSRTVHSPLTNSSAEALNSFQSW